MKHRILDWRLSKVVKDKHFSSKYGHTFCVIKKEENKYWSYMYDKPKGDLILFQEVSNLNLAKEICQIWSNSDSVKQRFTEQIRAKLTEEEIEVLKLDEHGYGIY